MRVTYAQFIHCVNVVKVSKCNSHLWLLRRYRRVCWICFIGDDSRVLLLRFVLPHRQGLMQILSRYLVVRAVALTKKKNYIVTVYEL